MAKDEIRVPLGIKDVDVLKVELEGETLHIEVESRLGGSVRFQNALDPIIKHRIRRAHKRNQIIQKSG